METYKQNLKSFFFLFIFEKRVNKYTPPNSTHVVSRARKKLFFFHSTHHPHNASFHFWTVWLVVLSIFNFFFFVSSFVNVKTLKYNKFILLWIKICKTTSFFVFRFEVGLGWIGLDGMMTGNDDENGKLFR